MTEIEEYLDNRKDVFFTSVLYSIVFGAMFLNGLLVQRDLQHTVGNIIIAVIGVTIFALYWLREIEKKEYMIREIVFISVMFTISQVILAVQSTIFTGCLWLLLVIVVAVRIGFGQAVSCLLLLTMEYVLMLAGEDVHTLELIYYALIGILFSALFSMVQAKKAFVCLEIVSMIVAIVLLLFLYDFSMDEMKENLKSCLIQFGSISTIFLIGVNLWFKRWDEMKRMNPAIREMHQKLTKILEADFELIHRMQAYSAPLFMHSMKVSMLSTQAALEIGVNPLLAKAGGLYHEVGRILEEEDYVEASINLTYAYDFPEELTELIVQLGSTYENPKSPEAAIVMLSDSILSTRDYLEKSGQREQITDKKLIENVFYKRISKGNLQESGLTDEQINALKTYYIKHAFEE